jgi:hypothetical protein
MILGKNVQPIKLKLFSELTPEAFLAGGTTAVYEATTKTEE